MFYIQFMLTFIILINYIFIYIYYFVFNVVIVRYSYYYSCDHRGLYLYQYRFYNKVTIVHRCTIATFSINNIRITTVCTYFCYEFITNYYEYNSTDSFLNNIDERYINNILDNIINMCNIMPDTELMTKTQTRWTLHIHIITEYKCISIKIIAIRYTLNLIPKVISIESNNNELTNTILPQTIDIITTNEPVLTRFQHLTYTYEFLSEFEGELPEILWFELVISNEIIINDIYNIIVNEYLYKKPMDLCKRIIIYAKNKKMPIYRENNWHKPSSTYDILSKRKRLGAIAYNYKHGNQQIIFLLLSVEFMNKDK
jgi:hypothetical protein